VGPFINTPGLGAEGETPFLTGVHGVVRSTIYKRGFFNMGAHTRGIYFYKERGAG